jgi:hypothetical protein
MHEKRGDPFLMSAAKKKGTAWESAIVQFLRANGVTHAERRSLGGTLDRGDIAGIPGIVIEAKSGALHLAAWVAEAETERANDGAKHGIVWAKRAGKTSPADGYAIMTGATLVALLAEAGYITDDQPAEPPAKASTLPPGSLLGPLIALVERQEAELLEHVRSLLPVTEP